MKVQRIDYSDGTHGIWDEESDTTYIQGPTSPNVEKVASTCARIQKLVFQGDFQAAASVAATLSAYLHGKYKFTEVDTWTVEPWHRESPPEDLTVRINDPIEGVVGG